MRKVTTLLLMAAMSAGLTGVAGAQDFNGAEAIARNDYRAAEEEIARSRRVFPNDADLLLNLATVYRATGRTQAARALYDTVLAQPDEALQLTQARSAGAHAIARGELARLHSVTLSAR